MSNKISVFTDGSCLNNGKKNSVGSIGIFFKDNDPDNLGQAIDNDGNKITNQTMELLAAIQALKIINDKIQKQEINQNMIYLYTDSSYLINSMTKWYKTWEANNWKNSKGKDVENIDLIKLLYELKSKYITIFKHIRSHQDEPTDKNSDKYFIWYGNYMADKLATDASRQYIIENQNKGDESEDPELEELIKEKLVITKKTKKSKKNNPELNI